MRFVDEIRSDQIRSNQIREPKCSCANVRRLRMFQHHEHGHGEVRIAAPVIL